MRVDRRKAVALLTVIVGFLCGHSASCAELQLREVKTAYGPFWPERESKVYYQGKDGLFFRFIVSGFEPTAQHGYELESRIALMNAAGDTIKLQTLPQQGPLHYGTTSVVGYAAILIDESCIPGTYTASLTVKDKTSGKTSSHSTQITVKAEEWAIAQVSIYADAEHRQATTLSGVVGETKHYALNVIGFDREGVDCQITARILGPSGSEVSKHEWSKGLKREGILPSFAVLTFGNNLAGFSAPGSYRLILTAVDRIKNRSATLELPFEIRLP